MAHTILSKDRVETDKNVKREREGDGERGRGRERKRERERDRKREREGGKGRVMYTSCAPFATMFSEKGGELIGDKFRYNNSKIHMKTIE